MRRTDCKQNNRANMRRREEEAALRAALGSEAFPHSSLSFERRNEPRPNIPGEQRGSISDRTHLLLSNHPEGGGGGGGTEGMRDRGSRQIRTKVEKKY